MGNCCIGKYKEDNKFLIDRLVEKEEKLQQSKLENHIYKNQLILTKAYYRNSQSNQNK